MSNTSQKTSTYLSGEAVGGVEITRFSGIDTDSREQPALSREGISFSDIENMRIKGDGSLETREGYMNLFSGNYPIRGTWSGKIHNTLCTYCVTGKRIYSVNADTGDCSFITELDSSEGQVFMIYFEDSVYIFDGDCIYRLRDGVLYKDFGYAPLIANNWTTSFVGEIYEPRNILSRYARFTYQATEPVTPFLRTVYPLESVLAVYVNGEPISSDRYYINLDINSVNVTGLQALDKIEIYGLLKDRSPEYQALASISCGIIVGSVTKPLAVLCGGERGNELYCSRDIAPDSQESCSAIDFDGGGLYIPEGTRGHVGDGQHSITALCRHYDRLLIFTEGETWMAKELVTNGELISAMTINSHVGAMSQDSVAMADNSPIAVNENGIFQFNSNTDTHDECNAYKISEPIEKLMDRTFLKNAKIVFNRKKGELLVYSKNQRLSSQPTAYVYNTALKCWYRFSGFNVDKFLNIGDYVGWTKDHELFIFNDSLSMDLPDALGESGTRYEGRISSNITELGTAGFKHLCSFSASHDTPEDCTMEVEILCDDKPAIKFSVNGEGAVGHSALCRRLSSGRIKQMKFSVRFKGYKKQSLHSLIIKVRK